MTTDHRQTTVDQFTRQADAFSSSPTMRAAPWKAIVLHPGAKGRRSITDLIQEAHTVRTDSRRSHLLLLFSLVLVVGADGCSAIKPVICSVTYPVRVFQSRLERTVDDDEDDEDYNDLPAAFLIPAAIVLTPFHFAAASVTGVVAGTASRVVSDLNVLVGNAEFSWDDMNLQRPFKTNAKRPPQS